MVVYRGTRNRTSNGALTELHDLAASFSHMETRKVTNDYTIQFQGKRYQIALSSITVGMKGQNVRVELRLDGHIAVRFKGQYLGIAVAMSKVPAAPAPVAMQPVRKDHNRGGRSQAVRMFSSPVSCRTKRASTRLVASSIIAIRYNARLALRASRDRRYPTAPVRQSTPGVRH